MISAKEAKEQSEKVFQADINVELEGIEREIKQAISNGEFYTYIETTSIPAREVLEGAGYKVEVSNQYNEFSAFIDWR